MQQKITFGNRHTDPSNARAKASYKAMHGLWAYYEYAMTHASEWPWPGQHLC